MKTTKKFEVEVFNIADEDTDYGKTKFYATYAAAVRYAKKIGAATEKTCFTFIYVPKNDGYSDYRRREEWTGGYHTPFLDCDIF